MTCKKVKRHLIAYLDGDLSEKFRPPVEDHLKSCQDCSHDLKQMKAFWVSGSLQDPGSPSPYIHTRFMQRIREFESRKHGFSSLFHRISPVLLPAGAVVLGIFAGIVIGNFSETNENLGNASDPVLDEFAERFFIESFTDVPSDISSIMVELTSAEGGVR